MHGLCRQIRAIEARGKGEQYKHHVRTVDKRKQHLEKAKVAPDELKGVFA